MARITSIGNELNTTTSNTEWSGVNASPTISSSVFRSGAYAVRINGFSSGSPQRLSYQLKSSATTGDYFARFYLRLATLPSAENRIIVLTDSNVSWTLVYFTIDNSGVLKLYDEDGQITGTITLSVNIWYRVEIEVNTSGGAGTHVVTGRVNGTNFASASNRSLSAGLITIAVGGNLGSEAQTTGDWYFDDIAINDSSGSFQNSWAGSGKIIHLKPNAAGDNSDWTNDYTNVDEVTPDNATTIVSSNTLDQIDDHNIEASGIASTDTVNVVQVGVRFNGVGASANASFVLRIKASASGTVEESSAITPSNTTWVTNAAASPRNYSLTLYDLPGGSTTAWTKSDLDSAQIGYRLSSTSTNAAQISTVWLLVDYTPNEPRLLRTYSGQNDASSSITISSVDCSGTNTYLVVKSGVEANTTPSDRPITGVTFNTSENLSQLVSQQFTSGGGEDDQVEIWGLVAPTATTADVVVTYTGAVDGCAVIVEVWENVLQSSSTEDPQSNGVTSTGPATITVTPTVDNTVIIGAGLTMSSSRTLTPSTGVEESGNFANSGQLKFAGGYRYVGPAAAKALAWTIDSSADWIIAAVALKPYVEAAPSNTHPGYYGGEGWF